MVTVILKEDNKLINAILLARFNMIDYHGFFMKKIFGKGRRYHSIDLNQNYCLVFIPWKHAEKELRLVHMEDIYKIQDAEEDNVIFVDKFISPFIEEEPYYTEFKISEFRGYDFVFKNAEFIANVREQCFDKPLTILYNAFPELLTIDLQNEE